MATLTAGAIQRIVTMGEMGISAVLQVLTCEEMAAQNGKIRWRVTLSDGGNSTQTMVTGGGAALFKTSEAKAFSIVRIKEYQLNYLAARKIFIIVDFDVIEQSFSQIGMPVMLGAAPPADDMGGGVPVGGAGGAPAYGAGAPAAAAYAGAGAVVRAAPAQGAQACMPIAQLNPYVNRWNIKVRVLTKGEIRTWDKPNSSGKLFKIDIVDEKGDEISATFFKDAVDKFRDMIEVGSVYYMSGGRVKMADKKYSGGKDYELNFDEKASIVKVADDSNIKTTNFDIKPIAMIESMEKDTVVDVQGILKTVGDIVELTSKQGKPLVKRDVHLFDESLKGVDLTLWGESARNMNGKPGEILAIKGAKVSDWNTRSLAGSFSSIVHVNPNTEAAFQLGGWFSHNPNTQVESLSMRSGGPGGAARADEMDLAKRKVLASLREENVMAGVIGQDDYLTVRATVDFSSKGAEKVMYAACKATRQDRMCNKKLDDSSGQWICPNCGPQEGPDYRYIFSARFYDHTGSSFATMFNTEAQLVLGGVSANDLHAQLVALAGREDDPEFESIFKHGTFREYLITCRCKMETVRDEQRLKTTIVRLKPIENDVLVKENRATIDAIKRMMAA